VGANPTGAQAAKTLDAGGDAMTKAADNFNKINPPPDAKHAHGEIVDGLRKFAATFHDAAGKARSNDVKGARDELSGIATSPGAVEIQKAQDELTKAGYKFANG
jgi:hypothetical protein